jgi:hypothetical protein
MVDTLLMNKPFVEQAALPEQFPTWPGAFTGESLTRAVSIPTFFPSVDASSVESLCILRGFLVSLACPERYTHQENSERYLELFLVIGRILAFADASGVAVRQFDTWIRDLPERGFLSSISGADPDSSCALVVSEKVHHRSTRELLEIIQTGLKAFATAYDRGEYDETPVSTMVKELLTAAPGASEVAFPKNRCSRAYFDVSSAIAQHAPHLRVIQFQSDWNDVQRCISPCVRSFSAALARQALVEPRIVLHTSRSGCVRQQEPDTCAVVDSNGISFATIAYDSRQHSTRILARTPLARLLLIASNVDSQELARCATLFPVLEWESISAAISKIVGDEPLAPTPELERYMSDQSMWLGPIEKIEPDSKSLAKDRVAKIHGVLAGSVAGSSMTSETTEALQFVRRLLGGSAFNSYEIESFLFDGFIKRAIDEGKALKDLTIYTHNKHTAQQWLEYCKEHCPNAHQHIAESFQVRADGGVQLTPRAVTYLLNVVDPRQRYQPRF